jgi:Tol biopolymer transport system component
MGKVWRARHSSLKRDDALKVLPDSVAGDAGRIARFRREAQVLASLNHPNIAHVYGFEDAGGVSALVMELVEGETLADRTARGPIPVDEALRIARQIAEAVAAAHEHGVIHRDLKPANVKVTRDGTVKVLDFGLAKVLDVSAAAAADLPTMTSPALSEVGVLLGTTAYMAPEQARGGVADKRSDIWSFGCVLYEMLAGRRAFGGRDAAETIACVMTGQPDWNALPPEVPSAIRALLERCLAKDREHRIRDIGAALLLIEEAPRLSSTAERAPRPGSRRAPAPTVIAAVGGTAAASFIAALLLWPTAPDQLVYRTSVTSPEGALITHPVAAAVLAISPDGRRLAYTATGADGRHLLWIHNLDTGTARPVEGTEGAGYMFWSPDGRFVAFTALGQLKKVDTTSYVTSIVSEAPVGLDGTWGRGGDILFAGSANGRRVIVRVPEAGGSPVAVTSLDAAAGDNRHLAPYFLPDGRHFLYLVAGSRANGPNDPRGVYVGSLDRSERPRLVLEGGSNAKYADGHLFFLRGQALMAQPFDPETYELSGTPYQVADNLDISGSLTRAVAAFSLSNNGVLAYLSAAAGEAGTARLAWFDRSGKQLSELDGPNDYSDVALSPDARQAAVALIASAGRGREIWIYDIGRRIKTRFSLGDAQESVGPVWSPDGGRIAFGARRQGPLELYQRPASGAGGDERLLGDARDLTPYSWSRDGSQLLFMKGPVGVTGLSPLGVTEMAAASDQGSTDLWVRPMNAGGEAVPFLTGRANESQGQFSPDGRKVAYVSTESGRPEVYVVSYPRPDGRWQVSTMGGRLPRWRRDGREIFFLSQDNRLMAAQVEQSDSNFAVTSVQPLFDVRHTAEPARYIYDVTADGQRFLVSTRQRDAALPPPTLLTGWQQLRPR